MARMSWFTALSSGPLRIPIRSASKARSARQELLVHTVPDRKYEPLAADHLLRREGVQPALWPALLEELRTQDDYSEPRSRHSLVNLRAKTCLQYKFVLVERNAVAALVSASAKGRAIASLPSDV